MRLVPPNMDRFINDISNISHTKHPETDTKASISNLTDLPHDVFLLIIYLLTPTETVLCRRVSRAWHAAFTNDEVGWSLMKRHFPRVREMRNASRTKYQSRWADMFLDVAHRYHNLRSARFRSLERVNIGSETERDSLFQLVEPWRRWLRWNDYTAVFQEREPTWCLDHGLLVYQRPRSYDYVAYDLDTEQILTIPFGGRDKLVRRLRLAHGILIIEWCQREPSYQIDDGEGLYHHFVTAFDVRRSAESGSWEISFRSEWKLHHAGLRLTSHDRFFSAHSRTHYALYLWRHDGPPENEGDPAEQLTIWDIRDTSPDRPSAGGDGGARTPDATRSQPEPRVIRRLTEPSLDSFGIRQRRTPTLREILLDEANVYVHEETHRWLAGPHAPVPPPRHHHVRAIGIPISGVGPPWFDECCAEGDIHMNFCPRAGSAARFRNTGHDDNDDDDDDDGYHRQQWQQQHHDDASSSPSRSFDAAWPGWAPCWRHEEFPYLTVSEVVDARAGVRFAARQCFVMEALSSFVLPRISSFLATRKREGEGEGEGEEPEDIDEARFADGLWMRLLGKGRIVGDERWVVGEDEDGRGVTVMRF